MSKVLVIYAHPETAKGSSTHELYKHFINSYTAKNPNDEIIVHNISEYMPFRLDKLAISIYNKNLAKSDLTPDEIRLSESRDKWLDEFIHADKYVFANPMYNLFIPAEMKRYIDMIMQAGKTFHYDDKGLSVWGLYPHMMKPYNTSAYKGLIALKHLMAPLVAPKFRSLHNW